MTILLLVSENVSAQRTNDEFKLKLKQSLKSGDLNLKSELKPQSIGIQQYEKEVLKVSPTTQLPTKFDRIEVLHPIPPEQEIHINMTVTNVDTKSQPARSAFNYDRGAYIPIPDPTSISQFCQHTRNDYGLGFYADKDSPEWLRRLRNRTTPQYRNIDLDPVRAIQRMKAKKRAEKVKVIKKAYGME